MIRNNIEKLLLYKALVEHNARLNKLDKVGVRCSSDLLMDCPRCGRPRSVEVGETFRSIRGKVIVDDIEI